MQKFKISDIQELFASDVERFHSLTQTHVNELLTSLADGQASQESLDEALRQAHTLKGLAATVEAWGLSCLGADLEKLLELAGSWMHNEPEQARGIFEFIIEHMQDWFVMNQFTCMDMLPEAWDIYQGLRATMDERWPGYLAENPAGFAGDHQFVRLEALELGGASPAAEAEPTEETLSELDVQEGSLVGKPSTPAPLHVVPPVLRHREPPAPPAAVPSQLETAAEVGNLDVQQSEPILHGAAPATPTPLQVVPPSLRRKAPDVVESVQAGAPAGPDATKDIAATVPPIVPPVVAQTVTPPTAAAAVPVAEAHAAPPILRVAPPALKRRVKKVAAEPQPAAPVVESTATAALVELSAAASVEVPPVIAAEHKPAESLLPPTVEPLAIAQSVSSPRGVGPLPAQRAGTAITPRGEPPVVELAAGVPPVAEFQTIDQAFAGSSEDAAEHQPAEFVGFAPPSASPEASVADADADIGKEFETKFLAAQKPAVDADLLEMLGQEVAGYLAELSANLTELAANLADEAHWEKTRRLFHTIKGTAATFHLDAISAPAKAAEAHCIVAIEDAHARSREAFETCVHRASVVAKALALPFNEAPLREALELGLARAAMQDSQLSTLDSQLAVALDPEMAGFFIRDARDQIEVIEQALLRWEKGENSTEQVQAAQRGFHTIKGAGNSIGLTAVAQSVHEVEAFLEGVAAAGVDAAPAHSAESRALFTFLFGAVDQLRQYLAELTKNTASPWRNDWSLALQLLCAPANSDLSPAATVVAATLALAAADEDSHSLRIDAERLYQLMNLIGEMVVDRSRLARKIEQLTALHRALAERNLALSSAVQSFQKEFEFNRIQKTAERQGRQAGKWESGKVGEPPTCPPAHLPTCSPAHLLASVQPHEFSELEFDRYDQFNVLARSLVEVSHDIEVLNEEVAGCLDSFAAENVQFAQTSQSLQSKVTSLSLVPVQSLFPRLQRAFRDACSVEGKVAELSLAGGEALLDKVVVDKVYAPLLHLLRNAVAHGIEGAGVREKLQKPARGAVCLSAVQMSNQIVIQISDDGAGVDAKAVRQRAIAKGWLPKEAPALSPEQVVHFIFQPGFSTAAKVTSVSGRGIGLDVVRKEVEALNGAVELRFEAGVGSTWTLRLPLTLSISEAILAEVRGTPHQAPTTFAFPMNFIESGLVLDAPTSCRADGREVYEVVSRPAAAASATAEAVEAVSEWLPVVRLSSLFQMSGGEGARGVESNKGLIVSVGERRAIVVVDAVLTRQEIVIKQLDSVMSLHPLLNGATLDAEGRVIPILNLPTLLKFGEQAQTGAAHGPAAPKPGVKAGQLRVLIVDDSLSVRKVQERYLAELGCQVTVASDGLFALEKLREQEFDFVFTDLEMPRLNGYELITELRGNPVWASIPIVVISSRGADKYITKAMNLGATTFLSKPFTQEQLKQVLGHYAKAAAPAV